MRFKIKPTNDFNVSSERDRMRLFWAIAIVLVIAIVASIIIALTHTDKANAGVMDSRLATPIPVEQANFQLLVDRSSSYYDGNNVKRYKWTYTTTYYAGPSVGWKQCGRYYEPCPKTLQARLVLSKDKKHFKIELGDGVISQLTRVYLNEGTAATEQRTSTDWPASHAIPVKVRDMKLAHPNGILLSAGLFGQDPGLPVPKTPGS